MTHFAYFKALLKTFASLSLTVCLLREFKSDSGKKLKTPFAYFSASCVLSLFTVHDLSIRGAKSACLLLLCSAEQSWFFALTFTYTHTLSPIHTHTHASKQAHTKLRPVCIVLTLLRAFLCLEAACFSVSLSLISWARSLFRLLPFHHHHHRRE